MIVNDLNVPGFAGPLHKTDPPTDIVTRRQSKGARVTRRPASAHHPKSDDRKVMIERVGKPYSRTLHDREAGGIDGGQFVEVGTPEIFPRSLQSRRSQGRMLRVPGRATVSFHANATSLLALRSRKVNVSMTTGTEVCSLAPAARNRSHCSRACACSGSRDNARAIHAPPSTKTGSPCRITARRKRYRARSSCVSARRPRSQLDLRLAASE